MVVATGKAAAAKIMMRSALAAFIISAAVLAESPKIDPNDPVAQLQEKLLKGEARLTFHPELGYLPSLLKALKIPESSQGLVFSKTSLQLHRIHPQAPRAIYFNDDVYVGYVSGGDLIEIASVDSNKGSVFYVLEQDPEIKPAFSKRDDCLQCHQSQKTFDVPGLLLRSVWTLPNGYPDFKHGGGFFGEDAAPMKDRWGGWYVSGKIENDVHMGNFLLRGAPETADLTSTSSVTDLDKLVNTNRYLTPHSDIVALMALQHQVEIHNLITRANLGSRAALEQNAAIAEMFELKPGQWTDSTKRRINTVTEALVKGLLFQGEYQLKGKVTGTSSFEEEFQKLGPFDSKGRSVRQFDLNTRMLKYPCSWLIYSEAFDALAPEVKEIVYKRIYEILNTETGKDTLQILVETKPAFREAVEKITQPQAAENR